MDVSENCGFSPPIIHVNRVFHYFHHPFWGGVPLFLVQHPNSEIRANDLPDFFFEWPHRWDFFGRKKKEWNAGRFGGGQLKLFSYFFSPKKFGERYFTHFDSYFSTGLVQPATRGVFVSFIFMSLETSDAPFWANPWNGPFFIPEQRTAASNLGSVF